MRCAVWMGLLLGTAACAQQPGVEARSAGTRVRVELNAGLLQAGNPGYRRGLTADLTAYVRAESLIVAPPGPWATRVVAGAPLEVVLVGDSTVATEGGWGPGFCATLTANVTCADVAVNGRSSKSFLHEGLWAKALNEHGQYYLIQFGHNDQKDDPARHTDPETTFRANLQRFVREVRAQGGTPVLVTPLSRRNYKDGVLAVDALQRYAAAMREVAAEQKVALVDLYALSTKLLGGMTQAQADTLDAVTHPDAMAENGAGAKPDRTHLNEKGKALFGRMVADSLARTEVPFGTNVKDVSAVPTLKRESPTDGK